MKRVLTSALVALGGLLAAGAAQAGANVSWSVTISDGYPRAPVYVEPVPVYAPPPPVYVHPAPVVYYPPVAVAPRRVVYAPAPVYVGYHPKWHRHHRHHGHRHHRHHHHHGD